MPGPVSAKTATTDRFRISLFGGCPISRRVTMVDRAVGAGRAESDWETARSGDQ